MTALTAFEENRASYGGAIGPGLRAFFARKAEQANVELNQRSVASLDTLLTSVNREGSYQAQALERMQSLEHLADGFAEYLDERSEKLEAALASDDPGTRYRARVYGELPWDED